MTTTSAWRWLTFEPDDDHQHVILSHAVHAWARHAMLENMRARYPVRIAMDEACPEMILDVPGMVISTRPHEVFDLLGLKLTIPCEDVQGYWEHLDRKLADATKWRQVRGGVQFIKVAGFHRFLVLTHNQAVRLHGMLDSRRAEAFRKDREHMTAWAARVAQMNGTAGTPDQKAGA